MIEAREPEPRVGVLALRPRVLGPVLDEVEPAPRVLDGILHVEREPLAAAQRGLNRDLERLAGGAERHRRAGAVVAPHRAHVQIDRVEHEPCHAVLDRLHRGRAVRVHAPELEVGPQREMDVQHVDHLVGPVLEARTRQRERTVIAQIPAPSINVVSSQHSGLRERHRLEQRQPLGVGNGIAQAARGP